MRIVSIGYIVNEKIKNGLTSLREAYKICFIYVQTMRSLGILLGKIDVSIITLVPILRICDEN